MRRALCPEVARIVALGRQGYGLHIEYIPLSEVTWVHWRGRRWGGVGVRLCQWQRCHGEISGSRSGSSRTGSS